MRITKFCNKCHKEHFAELDDTFLGSEDIKALIEQKLEDTINQCQQYTLNEIID